MGNKIYPCFICGEWFETVSKQKAHKCGKPSPVVEVVEKIKEDIPVVEESKDQIKEDIPILGGSEPLEETTDFNRKEAINALKEGGIISDKRSVTHKPDEELKEMLKEIEA